MYFFLKERSYARGAGIRAKGAKSAKPAGVLRLTGAHGAIGANIHTMILDKRRFSLR